MFEDLEKEDYSGLINKLKNILTQQYEPVNDPKEADVHYSTQEIFDQLQKLLPSTHYTPDMVSNWLHNAGFNFFDYGNMKFEWMMKKV
jgi:hypothetical protein